ncbi:MAG: hypothetical protein ACKOWG_04550, partial [Planctomycetia bacterium]
QAGLVTPGIDLRIDELPDDTVGLVLPFPLFPPPDARGDRRELPDVRVAFVAIAPSIKRWEQRERQDEANCAVRDFIDAQIDSQGEQAGLAFVDANAAFLGPDGLPAVECFLDDQQHPSTIGNARRAAIMRPLVHDLMQ